MLDRGSWVWFWYCTEETQPRHTCQCGWQNVFLSPRISESMSSLISQSHCNHIQHFILIRVSNEMISSDDIQCDTVIIQIQSRFRFHLQFWRKIIYSPAIFSEGRLPISSKANSFNVDKHHAGFLNLRSTVWDQCRVDTTTRYFWLFYDTVLTVTVRPAWARKTGSFFKRFVMSIDLLNRWRWALPDGIGRS